MSTIRGRGQRTGLDLRPALDMPTVIAPWSLLLSVGISMTVGVLFGLYPAVRAANLDPIEALRHE